ncbi:unnamed protein product [Gongylonema pulchrum]|uniref:Phosducin domain-containing protein n=1 Tax=Gongylonema pulchrum TaxID=637853 RepID=A0A183E2Q0_9BILA|nr:unnamed protein product [Gongylonema pulchrum]
MSTGLRNTGPKGVLDDYRTFQECRRRELEETNEKILSAAKYCTLSGRDYSSDLEILRSKRIQELADFTLARGKIIEITKKDEFLDFIETNRDCWILIHIYDDDNEGCVTLNKIFNQLALKYPHVKLAKVLPSVVGMSSQFVSFSIYCLFITI